MKKNHLLVVVLLLSISTVISCKGNEGDTSENTTARLQSYKTEYSLQTLGQGGGASVLQYDGQQRLTTWNNDSIRWHYAYRADGGADMYGEFLRDGAKQFTGTIVFTEAGLPEVEEYSFLILPVPVETPVPEVMKCAYDGKNRLIRATDKVDAGAYSYTINVTFLYEADDDNVTRIKYEWEVGGKTDFRYYGLEYFDKANPVGFYPELLMTTPMNGGYQVAGLAGYSRNKLLKRMNRYNKENVVTGMTDFDYQYDADGKITECTLTYQMLNDEGPMKSNDYIRFYDIEY